MRLLIISWLLLLFAPCFAQTKKTEGYVGNIPYSCATQFKGYYFTVERKDGYAIIDLAGNEIGSRIKPPTIGFTKRFAIDYGVYFAQEGDYIVLKNLSGKTIGQSKYTEISPFITDNTVVQVQSTPGTFVFAFIDTAGKEIVRFDSKKYSLIANPTTKKVSFAITSPRNFIPFSDGLTPLKSDEKDKYGFINRELKIVIPVVYKGASSFSEKLAAVQNNDGNWGYINTSGSLVIPYTYSRRPSRFSSGVAKVENSDGLYGYINKSNKVVIPARYKRATHFYKGYALVQEDYNSPALLIDTAGNTIATFPKDANFKNNDKPDAGIFGLERVEYPFYVSETLQQLVDEGKGIFEKGINYALIDNKGNFVLDFNYKYLSDYHAGKMFAHKSEFKNNSTQNTYGVIDDQGEFLINIVKPNF